ncbi:MAG: DUF2764 family protein [Methylococcaceae bacterium]|jgi:hypothetical protein
MLSQRYKYTMLLSSLPVQPLQLFSASQTSISRLQLDQRLALLDVQDSEDLKRIEELLHWSQIKNATDEFIVKKSLEVVAAINNPFLKKILTWRLEFRTLLAALRMRQAGVKQPARHGFHGIGRWLEHIEQNWQKNDFGLGLQVPWIVPAEQLLSQNKTYELEKLLLATIWQYYARECNSHYFDFPAVVIYVLRWDISYRWTLYHTEKATQRFDELVNAGIGNALPGF